MNTLICRQRQSGKTTELIKEVRAHDGYLIVHNFNRVRDLERKNPDLKGRIFAWNKDFKQMNLIAKEPKPLFIDDIDLILRNMFIPFELMGVSISIGE